MLASMFWRKLTFNERLEQPGVSCEETFEPDGSEQIRVYDVPWALRQQSVIALLGYPAKSSLSGGNFVARLTPHYSPEWLDAIGNPFLYCSRVGVKGIGIPQTGRITTTAVDDEDAEEVPLYTLARLTATYKSLPYDILTDGQMLSGLEDEDDAIVSNPGGFVDGNGNPDESFIVRYVTRQVHPQGEFFTLPTNGAQSSGMKYVGLTPNIVTQGIGKLIVPYNISYTWHQVPEICVPSFAINPLLTTAAAFDLAVGCVNLDTFDEYPPGTLLLMGGEFKQGRSPFGDRIYDVTYLMKYMDNPQGVPTLANAGQLPTGPMGHQFIYHPRLGGYVEVTTTGISNLPVGNSPTSGFISSILNWFNAVLTNAFSSIYPGQTPPINGVSIYDWAKFGPILRSA
jgi:hypothetical protein